MVLSNLKLNYISGILLMVFLFYMVSCHKTPIQNVSLFESEPSSNALDPQSIDESSGIADSKINQDYLWVQEDSGNPTQLFLISHDGKVKKSIFLAGIANRDWEDMTLAMGPDPSLDYLYLGDIGDNGNAHSDYTIYRFPEPSLTVDTVRKIDKIVFRYPDGSHDAEAFIVDDLKKEIYIITKRDTLSRVYRLKAGYSQSVINTLEYVTSLKFNSVVSACLSRDRQDLLIKTYAGIFHYDIKQDISLAEVFETNPTTVNYQVEPQGEAISFASDNTGFFTLSEKAFSTVVKLYGYKRR